MSEREAKKAQFVEHKSRRGMWLAVAVGALLVLAGLAWGVAGGKSGPVGPAAESTAAAGEVVRIPLSELADGQAHFYRRTVAGKELGFFLIKENDGTIRSAFDTCDACYAAKKGYRQEGTQMICNNCNQAFPVAKIGLVSGGCNPVPLPVKVVGAQLEIAAADLAAGARYF